MKKKTKDIKDIKEIRKKTSESLKKFFNLVKNPVVEVSKSYGIPTYHSSGYF
jgi:hypothetical protein